MSKLRILGVDPGFANVGFCIVDILPMGGSELVATKLVTTSPEKGKSKNINDEIRRLALIEDAALELVDKYSPDIMVTEEPGKCLMRRNGKWATNPSLLRTSCLMWGSIHGLCRAKGIYTLKVGSKDIKFAMCGKKNASKEEVITAAKLRYPSYSDWPTTKKVEHVADAVGAAITGLTDPVVMVMTKRLRTEYENS